MMNAVAEVIVMISAIGKLSFELNNPTPDDARPATPICKNPSNADALPIFFVKGASASAVALGFVRPRHVSATKNKAMVVSRPYQLFHAPSAKTLLVPTKVYKAN